MSEKTLLAERRFWPLFWTQFFGAFNDNVLKNAIVILITYRSAKLFGLGTDQMVALCGGLFILPFFLFSAFSGEIADKWPKHQLAFTTKIAEIGFMVLASVGFLTDSLPTLLVALFMMGAQSTLFGPVKYSILPELLHEDELVKGNALVEMGTFLAILLGTLLGGILAGMGENGAYYVSGTILALAVIGALCGRMIQPTQATTPDLKLRWGLVQPNIEIVKLTAKVKSVHHAVLGISWFWFFGAALLSIFPIYVKDVLHCGEHVVTLFLALFSVGVAIGSVICEKMSHKRVELGLVPVGSIGISLFTLDLFLVGAPAAVSAGIGSVSDFFAMSGSWRITADLLLLSILSGFFIVPLYTFIQTRSEPHVRSRVVAGNNIYNALFMVVSAIMLMGLYAMGMTPVQVLLVLAVLNAIVAAYIYTVIPEFLWRFLCVFFARFLYRLKVVGEDHIPHDGPAVLVCNHVSFVDWLVIAGCVRRPVRFVMHYYYASAPGIGFALRGAKVIPIAGSKEDPKLLDEAFKRMAQALGEGEIVCIFPEGTITRNGELSPYRQGIERIIKETPVPVIPMVLKGLWGSFFSRKHGGRAVSNPKVIRHTWMSQVTLEIGKPLPPQEVTAVRLQEIAQAMLTA